MSNPLPPGSMPPGSEPPPKKGLSTGCIVALVIVGLILLLFGICVAYVFTAG